MQNTATDPIAKLTNDAVDLLKSLIKAPSLSREEGETANILQQYLEKKGCKVFRMQNNVWVFSDDFRENRPTILLNSHHDTVKPAQGWQRDPFNPEEKEGKIYGLGSNDAGGSLVSLLHTFLHLNHQPNDFNLIFAATAEEEISGPNGIQAVLSQIGKIDLGIVGEPTEMQMAVAEKGLMVIDAVAHGEAGHAARNEGKNAIYLALDDIAWLRKYKFPEKSETLGEINLAVTQIEGGTQHNVVPDQCKYVIDVRTHEKYTNQQVFEILQKNTQAELKARSFRLNSSGIPLDHPIVAKGKPIGLSHFGSPTLSDQALMDFPTLKIGPGKSSRSHTPDEFIKVEEIREGIVTYIQLLEGLKI